MHTNTTHQYAHAGHTWDMPRCVCYRYVKNLPPETTELMLYQKFAPHGAILSCKVQTDPVTGKCR